MVGLRIGLARLGDVPRTSELELRRLNFQYFMGMFGAEAISVSRLASVDCEILLFSTRCLFLALFGCVDLCSNSRHGELVLVHASRLINSDFDR